MVRWFVVGLLLVSAGVVSSCEEAAVDVAEVPERVRTTRTLLAAPEQFQGEQVAVRGRVTEVPDPVSFVLDDRLLVIEPENPLRQEFMEEGDVVVVTGELQRFRLAMLGELREGLLVNEALYRPFVGRPMLDAAGISFLESD